MKKENKSYLAIYVDHEIKDRFMKIKKQNPLKNDAFVSHLLDLYEHEQNQEKESKENDK